MVTEKQIEAAKSAVLDILNAEGMVFPLRKGAQNLGERIARAALLASQSTPAPPEGDYDTLRIEAEYLAAKESHP